MDYHNKSIFSNENKYFELKSSGQSLVKTLEDFIFIQRRLIYKFHKPPLNNFKFQKYQSILYGSGCDYLVKFSNCSLSLIGFGVQPGLSMYISEIKSSVLSNQQVFHINSVKDIEKYSGLIAFGFVNGLKVFNRETQVNIDESLAQSKIVTGIFCVFLVGYYFLIARGIPADIRLKIESLAKKWWKEYLKYHKKDQGVSYLIGYFADKDNL